MKYPQSWRDACGTVNEEKLLDRLSEVGALREIPKPREWLICPECHYAFVSGDTYGHSNECKQVEKDVPDKRIKTIEVIE